MLPCSIFMYSPDQRGRHGILGSKSFGVVSTRSTSIFNLSSLILRKFGLRMVFPFPKFTESPFSDAILDVLFPSTNKEMTRAKAGSIVALVAYIKATWDRANRPRIGQLVYGLFLKPDLHSGVSVVVPCTRPFHTGIIRWDRLQQLLQQFVVANLVSRHLSALPWRRCMASLRLERFEAFSILPNSFVGFGFVLLFASAHA